MVKPLITPVEDPVDSGDPESSESPSMTETNILRSFEIVSRAMNSAGAVEHIIDDVLDAVFGIFGCDRIWLFHPCDPNTATIKVLAEKNKPEYPGAFASGEEIPIDAEASETIRKALAAGSPVVFGPWSENNIGDVSARFPVLSQMLMAIHPKTGKPWMFGMHQCAYPRLWTEDEQLLFKEISYRVVEGLNNLILLKDLKESHITQRKLAEEQKAELEEKLRQALKMEAIGTLAGGIAYDFNNILGAMLGYAELAKESSSSLPEISGKLDKLIQAGHRAEELVKQILTFSRQAVTERIALLPANLVTEAVKMLRPILPATIDIVLRIDPKAGPVFADPTQIHRILMNLCTNAFHAMEHAGGRLEIMLRETTLSASDPVKDPGIEAGKYVQLSICDTGCGIDHEIRDKIFDPYFTTKEAGRGTGMGLSVAHGIVKSYGGAISIVTGPGKGTAVHVFLPIIDADAVRENDEVEPIPGGERILFIEDEEIL